VARHLNGEPAHIPSSTYRLQLNQEFTFRQALGLVDYLHALGIGDCYLSPFLMAVEGSMHGYNITNPGRINPEIGTLEELRTFSDRLKQSGMGMIADVVPNHLAIARPANQWWWNVLENGPSSPFSRYFDINWHSSKRDLANKVLLPILGDQYGRVLEDRQITVHYESGDLQARVYGQPLPLAPRSWGLVLEPAVNAARVDLGDNHGHVLELESILTALSHLPPPDETDAGKVHERQREKEIIRKRLAALTESSRAILDRINRVIEVVNGVKGVPHSFDRLEELLARQSYRLAYWRVAGDEINYRRFFDVNELAAVRVEDPEVFQAMHALIFDLVRDGVVDGLRVDHSDGLLDPAEYFQRLQKACQAARNDPRSFYIVTEKILVGNEKLRPDWDIAGSTGYDFLGLMNGLFVDTARRAAFQHVYTAFTGPAIASEELVYTTKRLILQTSMSGELNALAGKLDKISEQHRWSRDFTLSSLRHVLRETIACFPIYRTYITARAVHPDAEDERHILTAVTRARVRNPSTDDSIFEFLQNILLLRDPESIDEAQRQERREFIMSFQQFTGPVMAKGLEDTAFYRQFPLASLNEVGGDPRQFGNPPAAFHARNLERLHSWPHALLASSTHDSKRSEDVRARINVLSEIPAEWYRAVRSWHAINRGRKTEIDGFPVPDTAVEYLFYQTLIGVWPLEEPAPGAVEEITARLLAYMRKALREAKQHSSWINPNPPYEQAVERFIRAALDPAPENVFLRELTGFVDGIKRAGLWNSLSQVLLKAASPGVPDFYQGSEIWDFTLVDPDNRRPVDYDRRCRMLAELREMQNGDAQALLADASDNLADGRLKLYVTSRSLCFRKSHGDLMAEGGYIPLRATGDRQKHVVAFARTLGKRCAIAAAGRFFLELGAPKPVGKPAWGAWDLLLRRDCAHPAFRDVFSRKTIESVRRNGKYVLPLAAVFGDLPVALLEAVE